MLTKEEILRKNRKGAETKKKKLSPKEKAFADVYMQNSSGVQAALKVYNTDDYSTAGVIAHENLKKPKVIDYITEKLNDKMLAEKHQMLLNKQEVIVRNNPTTGEMEIIPTGQIDVQAVKAGLDMAYKIKGKYKTEEKPPENKTTYNFVFNQSFKDKIKPLEEELKNQFRTIKPNDQ